MIYKDSHIFIYLLENWNDLLVKKIIFGLARPVLLKELYVNVECK
jgi:hypothetical protein